MKLYETFKTTIKSNLKEIYDKKFITQLNGLAIIIFYFIGVLAQDIIFFALDGALPTFAINFMRVTYNFLLLITLGFFARNLIVKSYKDLMKNHKTLFKKYLKFWFIALVGMVILNLGANALNGGAIATNEELIRQLFKTSPIYMYVSAVFIAPFLEEIVFRASLYQIFKNKYLFIGLSGFLFGAIHVLPGLENLSELAFIIPYSFPGFVFAYVLYESKNIFVPMGLHFLHNGVLMAIQTVLFMAGVL